MPGGAFATVADFNNALIRKTLSGLVAVAPPTVAALTDTDLFDATGLLPLPTGYLQLGLISDDGAQFSRSTDLSTVSSWGSKAPSRQDVKTDTTTLQVTCQQTIAINLALYYGVDPADITADATTKAIAISKNAIPVHPNWRVAVIGVDRAAAGEVVMCKHLPYASITAYGDDQWAASTDAPAPGYTFTFTGFDDPDSGDDELFFAGGVGWAGLLTDMAITTGV